LAVIFSGASCGDDAGGTGGSTPNPTTTASSTASTGGAGGAGGEGGEGGTYVCEPNEGVMLAISELRFGAEQVGGWKKVGMNIDGLNSTGNSTDVCQPNSGGSPAYAHPDGDDGIDNSFGKNLLPMINTFSPDFHTRVDDLIEEGKFNAMAKTYCLPPTGDAPSLVTKVFGGTDLGHAPAFDGMDVWPVAPELLGDPQDPESSTLIFPASSVIGNTFDSGPNVEFVLMIPLQSGNKKQVLKLSLHSARLIWTLSADRKSATDGVLAGVLNTEEVIEQVKKMGWIANKCEDSSYQSALTLIRQMSDIMTDGTQDPTATCDGISFGVNLDMREIQLGEVGPNAPPTMACP
jgi:hypothetical protein